MAYRTAIHSYEMADPGDTSGLRADLASGCIHAADIVAILAKTEGNGLDNDHSRAFATDALHRCLAAPLGIAPDDPPEVVAERVAARILVIVSGGVEGPTTPAMYVFTRSETPDVAAKGEGLAFARVQSRPLAAEEIGTLAQVHATEEAARTAAAALGLDNPGGMAFALCKAPLLTEPRLAEAAARGAPTVADSAHAAKPLSRAATALGIAAALGEVAGEDVTADALGRAFTLYSRRCSVTPGIDSDRVEILAFANRPGWQGGLRVSAGAMKDMLDAPSVAAHLAECGLSGDPQCDAAQRARLRLIVVKGEPPRSGVLRGARHVMWRDSDVHALRWFRASMAGLLAGLTGDTHVYIAAGAEHQGPAEGGTVAVFAEMPAEDLPH